MRSTATQESAAPKTMQWRWVQAPKTYTQNSYQPLFGMLAAKLVTLVYQEEGKLCLKFRTLQRLIYRLIQEAFCFNPKSVKMSLKKLFPVVLVAIVLVGMVSLQAFFTPEPMGTTNVHSDWCFQNCGQNESGTQYEISEACANCWMTNFARNDYQFNEVPGTGGELEPVLGVSIPLGDFEEVIAKVDELKGNGYIVESFGMFGLEVANDTDTPEPKLIFQVQGSMAGGNNAVDEETLVNFYYDFTSPCPTYCPKKSSSQIR
ncbi:MAG: hypothetical protein AAFV80_17385 [Bacteroidota bacterium]